MKKVIVFGAFDGLHPGHINFFEQAKKHGDFLIVSVGTDKNVLKIKKKKPLFNEQERLNLIKSIKIVNKAVLGSENDYYKHIKLENPSVVCLGYDQWAKEEDLKKELENVGLSNVKIVRLVPYIENRAKSTFVKKKGVVD